MGKDFLTDVQPEQPEVDLTQPFEKEEKHEQEEEAPAESSTEESQTEQPPSPDGGEAKGEPKGEPEDNNQDDNNLPFHKHPRWKAMNDENVVLKKSLQEFMESQKQVLQRIAPPAQTSEQIPDWFVQAYGDDPQTWNVYQNAMKEQRESIKAELKREQEETAAREQAEKEQYLKWVDDSLASVEKTYGVKLKEKDPLTNKFIQFVVEYKPTDDQGNLDMVRGWKLFAELNKEDPAKMNARKAIASASVAPDKGAGVSEKKDYFTPKDFKGKGWKLR